MSHKHGDAHIKKEGEKKKAKTTVTWHSIKCEGIRRKKEKWMCPCTISTRQDGAEEAITLSPQPKAYALETVEDNPIELRDEGDD